MIPDKLWELIKPSNTVEGAGLACGMCIMTRLEDLGEYMAFTVNNTESLKQPSLLDVVEDYTTNGAS
jgi:hypothetical protein